MFKLSNNQRLLDDYQKHVESYVSNLASIVSNIEAKPALSIESKRIDFINAVIFDSILMIHRIVSEGNVSAKDERVRKLLNFVIKHYQWEGSNKAKLEAIIELCVQAGNIEIGDHLYAHLINKVLLIGNNIWSR